MNWILHQDTHHQHQHCHLYICPSDLSEGVSLIFFASVLGNLLEGRRPLGPFLHFDQTGQQANQQKENQHAQQGDDGHIQWLQLVGCMTGKGRERQRWERKYFNWPFIDLLNAWIQQTKVSSFVPMSHSFSSVFNQSFLSPTHPYVALPVGWWTRGTPVCQ